MAGSTETANGVFVTASEAPEDGNTENLGKADIERLGRERPDTLSNWAAEAGFVFAIVSSLCMSEYFISGFNIVLPAITESLQIPESQQTWPAGVINLTTAALLLPFARLCSQYGGRNVFLGGHVWLLIWSIVCGFSKNPIMLIVGRAMQGIGASAFLPAGLTLLGQTYRPGPRKNLVFSLYGAAACIGFYFGIIMGAVTGQLANWRVYFFVGSAFEFLLIVTGFFTIPRHLGHDGPGVRMDWWGACTIVPGLVLVVYALTDGGNAPDGWRTPYIYVTFIMGGLMLCAAVYVQGWVSAQPLLPADLFRPKYMKRISGFIFCGFGVFSIFLFYASFYIQNVLHATPLQTAVWFIPLALGGFILAITGGFVLHILSGQILLLVSCMGYILCVLLFPLIPSQDGPNKLSTSHIYWAYVFPSMICSTIGIDITYNVTNVFSTTAMPRRLQATAAGWIISLGYLGMAFWLGVAELAVSSWARSRAQEDPTLREKYQIGFWTGLSLAGVAFACAATTRIGQASAELTADEKDELEKGMVQK
ncbi:MFS general substrate transporter [Annulohypoxylon truncatum]|uniref:MFS general substrate transporter n=1 Tax=Annulohypoxylon truncatum TaxID=327061 RepID=UPI0020078526|nr:MFS general substrate transporter [Annulohypoxylon truncatum]KAI1207841.1 MFS general substrate transporter [Annulohypoxylon truncatum]